MDTFKSQETKVAFVHDFLVSYGGAERVLEGLMKLYPDAPVYTLLYDRQVMGARFRGREIRTSFLQKFPKFLRKRYRWLLPFYPVAVETFDLREFDLVISSSGAWSKGIVTRTTTRHIAYLHSPMRLLWDANERYLSTNRVRGLRRFFSRLLLSYLRLWDREAADRPDTLVSNSEYTKRRAEKYYRRSSTVLYPPVGRFGGDGERSRKDFFLVVARLTESKGVDIAIEAFGKLGLPLTVVGEGRERRRLERIAGSNVSFRGWVDDADLGALYAQSQAVVVPSEEDFGMVAAEAIAHGTPAIAFSRGGSAEVVREGETGELFHADTPEVLADAARRFLARGGADHYVSACRADKDRFSENRFLSEWRRVIDETMNRR